MTRDREGNLSAVSVRVQITVYNVHKLMPASKEMELSVNEGKTNFMVVG